MIRNNNKGIVSKLTLRSIQSSKMRNIFILLTIVLSVALVSGIAFLYNSIIVQEKLLLDKMQHVVYMDLTMEQADQIKRDSRVDCMRIYKTGTSSEIDTYIIQPMYIEQVDVVIEAAQIVEGRYPDAYDEIAVDKSYMQVIGEEAVLGASIMLNYWDGTSESFVITGFTDTDNITKVYPIYMSELYSREGTQLKDTLYMGAVRIKGNQDINPQEFLDTVYAIGRDNGIEQKYSNINNFYYSTLSMTSTKLLVIVLIVISILMISILVIYSIFYLGVVNRIRDFGQLRTLGMTARQVRKMVRLEGAILCLLGAPFGLILGGIFSYVMAPQGWDLKEIIPTGLLIWLADFITVSLSVRKPAKVAASISPVEASKMRGYADSSQKNSNKLHRKLTPISMARMANARNRKKTLMTVLSLGVGGSLFLIGACLMQSVNREEFSREGSLRYGEAIIFFSSNAQEASEHGLNGLQMNNPMDDNFIETLKAIPGVTDITTWSEISLHYVYKNDKDDSNSGSFNREQAEILKKYLDSGSLDYDTMVHERQLIVKNNSTVKEIFGWRFETGDQILLSWFDGERIREEAFTIAGVVNDKVYNNDDLYAAVVESGWFLFPEETVKDMVSSDLNMTSTLAVATKEADRDKAMELIRDEVEQFPTIKMRTLQETLDEDEATFNLLSQILYGISIFIIGFSLINLVNTLTTNILSRQQEFASMQAIGMTPRQLTAMIQTEGLYLSFWNLCITVVVGTSAAYILISLLQKTGVNYMHFRFPILFLLGYAVLLTILPMIISHLVLHFTRKKSLVVRLREVT